MKRWMVLSRVLTTKNNLPSLRMYFEVLHSSRMKKDERITEKMEVREFESLKVKSKVRMNFVSTYLREEGQTVRKPRALGSIRK